MSDRLAALLILDGCPDGATAYALMTLHSISIITMAHLVRDGHATAFRQTMRPPHHHIRITRFRITPQGRKHLHG